MGNLLDTIKAVKGQTIKSDHWNRLVEEVDINASGERYKEGQTFSIGSNLSTNGTSYMAYQKNKGTISAIIGNVNALNNDFSIKAKLGNIILGSEDATGTTTIMSNNGANQFVMNTNETIFNKAIKIKKSEGALFNDFDIKATSTGFSLINILKIEPNSTGTVKVQGQSTSSEILQVRSDASKNYGFIGFNVKGLTTPENREERTGCIGWEDEETTQFRIRNNQENGDIRLLCGSNGRVMLNDKAISISTIAPTRKAVGDIWIQV